MWIFQPIFKSTIWGGHRIHQFMGLAETGDQIGESWCVSAVPGNESTVADGPDKGLTISQLIHKYKGKLLGKENFAKYGDKFPLLIKLIDAQDDLSVQVHPDDDMARRYGMPNGKTEMWYVMDAMPGARLASGFVSPIDPDEYENLIESGDIENKLRFLSIKKGDTFFIPAGNVHTIGKGAFIAEIQQSSDATYRLYDYHRKDKDGNERELHTELAKEAINFSDVFCGKITGKEIESGVFNLAESEYFTTNLIKADKDITRDYSIIDSFVTVLITNGSVVVKSGDETRTLSAGEAVLIPASAEKISIIPSVKAEILETYI